MKVPNIVLLTVDSLRTDHLHCYGYDRDTTPCVDELASRGTVFLQAISHGGGTPTAFPSILDSVLPPVHPSEFVEIMRRNVSIAEVLKQNGYATAAFHSNPYLSKYFGYEKGFDVFWDRISIADVADRYRLRTVLTRRMRSRILSAILNRISDLRHLWGPPIVRAQEITQRATAWLQRQRTEDNGKRFFLWVHYMDVHHPYWPPSEHIKRFRSTGATRYRILRTYQKVRTHQALSDAERELLIDLYDAAVSYVDDSIAELLKHVDLSSAVVIVASDHGDLLGEHGLHYHGELYEEVIHVPLVLTGYGVMSGAKVGRMVSHLDIAPTIAKVAGLSGMEALRTFKGRDLISAMGEDAEKYGADAISVAFTYPNREYRKISFRGNRWKYILTERLDVEGKGTKWRSELYDLRSDPHENVNLCELKNAVAGKFESHVLQFLAQKEARAHRERCRP
jgi:arylsulfatase A-like enzyme